MGGAKTEGKEKEKMGGAKVGRGRQKLDGD